MAAVIPKLVFEEVEELLACGAALGEIVFVGLNEGENVGKLYGSVRDSGVYVGAMLDLPPLSPVARYIFALMTRRDVKVPELTELASREVACVYKE